MMLHHADYALSLRSVFGISSGKKSKIVLKSFTLVGMLLYINSQQSPKTQGNKLLS